MQCEHDKDCETKSRQIMNISDITRIQLRCRIQKIYDMLTHVVEGYGTFYYNKHGNPLLQETVDKITCLYHNRIERRCIEVGLTVDEEREWDSDDANVDVDALSESGEESEEHDLDDICFYSEDDYDDVDNIDGRQDDGRHNDGTGQHGDGWHHGSNGQQSNRRHYDGDERHDDAEKRG